MLGAQIATLHNLSFFLWLTQEARRQLLNGTFSSWKNQLLPELGRRL
ncbi:MAG: hypothetical protein ACKOAY_03870 [Haliscomenobacter sp.]